MKHLLLWLNPKTFLRGLAFGYLFGLVGWVVLLVMFELRSPTVEYRLDVLLQGLHAGFIFAIPWAVLWAGSGIACSQIPGHPGTLSTLFALACVIVHVAQNHTFGGWTPLVIIFHMFVAIIPCHMLGYIIAALFGRIRDPEEAA